MSNIPERIGRYSILEQLAVGGMAVVYLAFETGETGLQRLVVIKQILPQFEPDDGFQRMFLQEEYERYFLVFRGDLLSRNGEGPRIYQVDIQLKLGLRQGLSHFLF